MFREYQIEKDKELYNYGIIDSPIVSHNYNNFITTYKNADETAANVEKENILFSLLNSDKKLSPIEEIYRNRMISKILSTDNHEFLDKMLLSIHDFIVPVDYDHIMLNNYDRSFMMDNSLTENDMKKMKSFAAFLSNYFSN